MYSAVNFLIEIEVKGNTFYQSKKKIYEDSTVDKMLDFYIADFIPFLPP